MEKIRVKDTLIYTMIKYFALAMGFGRELVNAHGLGPELLGILGNLLLVLSYLLYFNLGIVYSMTKECSIIDDSDEKSKRAIINSTFSFLCILCGIFVALAVASFVLIRNNNSGIYIGLIFIIGALDQFRTFFVNYYRIQDDLKQINKIEIVYQCSSTIGILFLIKYKIYGVLIGFIIGGIATWIVSFKRKENFKFELKSKMLYKLVRLGLPLLVYNLGYYIFSTVDRAMIIKFLSNIDLGYYTFANQIAKATLLFISSVMFIYYPKALNILNLNNNSDTDSIKNYIIKFNKYIEVLGAFLIVVGSIAIVPFTNIIMTKYVHSIGVYRILSMSVIANQLAYFISVFILSNNHQIILVKLQGVCIVLAFIFNYIFLKIGLGLEGIALATLITNIIYSVGQHVIFSKMLYNKVKIKDIIKVYGKFISFIIIILIINKSIVNFGIYTLIIVGLFIIFYFKNIKDFLKSNIYNQK